MLAIASIAVVVGGRMAEQTRRVGLLKAVGATPDAGRHGAARGEPAARARGGDRRAGSRVRYWRPALASPAGHGLLGVASVPPVTLGTILLVVGVAVAVAAAATLAPALQGARTSTVHALNDPARPPRRRPR